MRRGKEIAQGSHASNAALVNALNHTKTPDEILKWIANGSKKICVVVESEQELLDIYNKACNAKLRAYIIRDAGHTEFNGVPTLTACAIGPNKDDEIDKITGNLKLY